MAVTPFTEKIATAGTLAFREEWGITLNKLALGVFCHGLMDTAMAEYAKRKRPSHLTDCVRFAKHFFEGTGAQTVAQAAPVVVASLASSLASSEVSPEWPYEATSWIPEDEEKWRSLLSSRESQRRQW